MAPAVLGQPVVTLDIGESDDGKLKFNEEGEVLTSDLNSDHSTITPDQVAASNKWYNEWAADDTHAQNLTLTESYFGLNCAYDLHDKTMEDL